MGITDAKYRKHSHHLHTNNKYTVRQWSGGDIEIAELQGKRFYKFNCAVCHWQALPLAVLCSNCMSASLYVVSTSSTPRKVPFLTILPADR